MNSFSRFTLVSLAFAATSAFAAEGIMCDTYYTTVARKAAQIDRLGANLSRLASDQLFDDLKIDVKLCISNCEGRKFDYCNDVARFFERRRD